MSLMRNKRCLRSNAPIPKAIQSTWLGAIYAWLCMITNNEQSPKHETDFDIGFFIINTICLVVGTTCFCLAKEYQWIAVLVIEYNWALDNMRHNREHLKS